jgi:hypothetical protein
MTEIPLNKALICVETEKRGRHKCEDCFLWNDNAENCITAAVLNCGKFFRNDGKNIIYKLVDYPVEKEAENV